MGSSKFVTTKYAASILGVTDRTIYRYTKKGLLEARCEGRSLLISEEDVVKMKKGRRDMLASPLQRDVIAKLMAEVQALKIKVQTMEWMLNIKYEPLNLSLPEADLLYKAAQQFSVEGWAPHIEEQWADYFVRMKIEDFEKIELATNDNHPWRPFLRLASTMHLNPWNKGLEQALAAGRTNIHQTAGVWCILKGDSPRTFDVLTERDATPLKKLIRRLKKDQNREGEDD